MSKTSAPHHPLKPPFPYFGGKGSVASAVWARFGQVKNYVEPFAGGLAVFLAAPTPPRVATLNDIDGFIVNFWRAVKHDPDAVAHYADWPVTEVDLFARQVWLVQQKESLVERLMADPEYYDAKVAGWWVWGQCANIADGWCSGKGPWWVEDGSVVRAKRDGLGVGLKRPDLGCRGVHRLLPDGYPQTAEGKAAWLRDYMRALSDRLRFARIVCGDFERALGFAATYFHNTTAIFLDPPYSAERDSVYNHDSYEVSHRAREWCKRNGDNPLLRIAICGYESEHNELEELGWVKLAWKAQGGYANLGLERGKQNRLRERIWFSPHCLPVGE